MESFKEYFTILFTVCMLCAISDMITDFISPGISAAIRIISGIVVLLTVFSVFFNGCDVNDAVNSLKEAASMSAHSENILASEQLFVENTKLELQRSISSAIYENFGIKPDGISIDFSMESKDDNTYVTVSDIGICLPKNTDELSQNTIKAFVDGLFNTNSDIYANGEN